MDPTEAQIIENELGRIQKGIFDSWNVFMSWYTWFFGANLLVLGWIFTKGITSTGKQEIILLSLAWIFFNILGIVTSLRLWSYSREASDEAKRLAHCIIELVGSNKEQHKNLGFPRDLASFGGIANAAALFVNLLLWLYVLVKNM